MRAVYAAYTGLISVADPVHGLGGKLLYAGELDEQGARLVRAANIAGAASLSATGDAAAQRRGVREGIVDFLVNSLDEALRILKNEVRKKQAVSVCAGLPPEQVLAEMSERGVLPDLLSPRATGASIDLFLAEGARRVELQPLAAELAFVVCGERGAEFEAAALEMIPASEEAARRWLRLSPRYLGPQARRYRSLACDRSVAAQLRERFGANLIDGLA